MALSDAAIRAAKPQEGRTVKLSEATEKPRLTLWSAHDFLQIEDTRNPAGLRTFTFEGSLAFLYAALVDRPCTATKIKEELSRPKKSKLL